MLNNIFRVIPFTFFSIVLMTSTWVMAEKTYLPVIWEQLIPSDYNIIELENELISQYDIETLEHGSETAMELVEALKALQYDAPMTLEYDQAKIRIPGFIVPLDFDGDKITHFLLVPYYGACIHTPPPPPNQIVYVIFEQGIQVDHTYDPVYVSGLFKVEHQESELGTAGYTLYGDKVEPYYE